jgi:phosphoribosylanthranilate isomerase
VLVKICGITKPADAEAAAAAGADLLGFVFRSGTPRALDPTESGWVRDVGGVGRVGVFLDSSSTEASLTRIWRFSVSG